MKKETQPPYNMPNENAPTANQEDESSEHELQQKAKDVARATEEMVANAVAGLKLTGTGSPAAAAAAAAAATAGNYNTDNVDQTKLTKNKNENKANIENSKSINECTAK